MNRSEHEVGRPRHRKHAAVLTTLATLAASAVAVSVPVGPAAADCVGLNNPTYIRLSNVNGIEIAYETTQYGSTCDGDSEYRGKVKDSLTDGSCAYAYFYDTTKSTHGVACTTGSYDYYTFWDRQSNSSAEIEVATSYRSTGRRTTWGF